jgi:hypothetical protein
VYLAYYRQTAAGYEIVVNRSRDFGLTWLGVEKLITSENNFYAYHLSSLPGGKAYLAYSLNGSNVYLARSSDSFDTFTTADVDQDNSNSNDWPKLCAQGNQLILVWMSPNAALSNWSVWGTVSSDGGATWAPRVQLRPEGTAGAAQRPDLACNGANAGVAVFEDSRFGPNDMRIYSNRYDGSSWGAAEQYVDLGSAPRIAFYSGSGVVVTYELAPRDVWLRRSTNGGDSWGFGEFYRADEFAPQPLADSTAPYPITDGAGNIWVAWKDASAGAASIAVSQFRQEHPWLPWAFGPVYRVNRETPQGVRINSIERYQYQPAAALPGVAFVAFNGARTSSYWDNRINAYEPGDMDRDGAAAVTDCNDADPGAAAAPVEVSGVAVSWEHGATRVAWTSQAATAGAGTTYDVVSGYASDLLATGTFGSASCLASALAAPPYDDARSGPPAQDGFYYLVRARNGCGTATFGDASVSPDPRDALDAGAPCP